MKFNPDKHKKKSIRLKNHNYSENGLYFITISIKNKLCLFGEINNNENILFDSGKMIEEYWLNLEKEFESIKLHNFIVMPNHFHWIVEIIRKNKDCNCIICNKNNVLNIQNYDFNIKKNYFWIDNSEIILNNKICPYNRELLWNIIWSFKWKTTNEYIKNVYKNNWLQFNQKLWQKNFYENIIKNEKMYLEIKNYIINNPKSWDEDKFYYTEI